MTAKDIAVIITAVAITGLMFLAGVIYHICEKIKAKRPHKSDDEEDNPITKFKDDLAYIYENYPNGKLKKLAQAVWNRVEEIEKWHNEEIHDWERKYYSARYSVGELEVKCDSYREELDEWTQRCEELQSKLNESQERLKRTSAREKTLLSEAEGLRKQYAELQSELEKSQAQLIKTIPIPRFTVSDDDEPDYLISENTFGGQINPFAKIIINTKPGEPLTATETTELAERLQRIASQPLVSKEDVVEKLRDWWGVEAEKAVEIALPNTDQKKQDDGWPEYMAKVEGVPKGFNKYKVTLYDNKENETIETELWGANIYDALKSVDEERYSAVGYRCVMRNKGWC